LGLETGCEPVAVIACGVEPPFEDVARDDQGSGNRSILGDLRVGPDIDHRRPALDRVTGIGRLDAREAPARLRQQIVDRRPCDAPDASASGVSIKPCRAPGIMRVWPTTRISPT
jgi:hypothetical protein